MSSETGDLLRIITDIRPRSDSERIFRLMKRQLSSLYRSRAISGYDLEYREVGGKGPILSEHASLAYWNAILRALSDIYESYKDTLRGIVILHGTDTMSYTAPFLFLRSENLHFPIILTGANSPPRITEDSPLDVKTDAWENIYTALAFIDAHGESAPGVYVSFASRIGLPINIRKVRRLGTRDRLFSRNPSSPNDFSTFLQPEPTRFYRFDNIGLLSPYMARLVSGELLFSQMFERFQRIMKNVYHAGPVCFREAASISNDSCFLLKISPALFPLVLDSHFGRDFSCRLPEKLSAVILEGYKSGTLPTQYENSLRDFCLYCRERGIPIILTTRYGLHEAEYGSTRDLPALVRPKLLSETVVAATYHALDEVESELTRNEEGILDHAREKMIKDRRSSGIERRLKKLEEVLEILRPNSLE